MKLKEYIWRELLYEALENRNFEFTQKCISNKLNVSIGSVFNAILPLRNINTLEVSGRGFKIINTKKLLYFFACHRHFQKDIIKKYFIKQNVKYREANYPSGLLIGGYSHFSKFFDQIPADYDISIIYIDQYNYKILIELEKRFLEVGIDNNPKNKYYNTYILGEDKYIDTIYHNIPIAQTFADIFNQKDWYAKDFIKLFEQKYEAILG